MDEDDWIKLNCVPMELLLLLIRPDVGCIRRVGILDSSRIISRPLANQSKHFNLILMLFLISEIFAPGSY
jgi:hypothetical protein